MHFTQGKSSAANRVRITAQWMHMWLKHGTVDLPPQPGRGDCRMHGQLGHRQIREAKLYEHCWSCLPDVKRDRSLRMSFASLQHAEHAHRELPEACGTARTVQKGHTADSC